MIYQKMKIQNTAWWHHYTFWNIFFLKMDHKYVHCLKMSILLNNSEPHKIWYRISYMQREREKKIMSTSPRLVNEALWTTRGRGNKRSRVVIVSRSCGKYGTWVMFFMVPGWIAKGHSLRHILLDLTMTNFSVFKSVCFLLFSFALCAEKDLFL